MAFLEHHPNLVEDLSRCDQLVKERLNSSDPIFLGRMGGSDTDLMIDYFAETKQRNTRDVLDALQNQINLLQAYNGYYDKAQDISKIHNFYEKMCICYRSCPEVFLVGGTLLSEFLPNTIHPVFQVDPGPRRIISREFVLQEIVQTREQNFLPYSYVERLVFGTTLFRAFEKLLTAKRVLVITPFSSSIEKNFPRRASFFRNFNYPEFQLQTYTTPITYAGLPLNSYPDRDWFETSERMINEVSKLDFDIALLACGSYAVPMGVAIRDDMARKAVYVGGCLQLFFGIMGRRYNNKFFLDQINPECFIYPVESVGFQSQIDVSRHSAAEAFGAYF